MVSTDAYYQFHMPTSHLTLTAHFESGNYVPERQELPVSIFPNPVRSHFMIHSASVMTHVIIVDISGSIVFTQNLNHHKLRMENQWDAGVYIVKIKTTEGVYAIKMLVEQW